MLFGFVIFLSAFLLFQLQLIIAKHLLPWFGGTPAVWTTSQMFFQILLLGGYTYAYFLTKTCRTWVQCRIHVSLLLAATVAVCVLVVWGGEPLLAPDSMRPAGSENPVLLLLWILTVSVGLPFFVVSTTAPLLQHWHSRQSASLSGTYRLYALSNGGSFLALISYPSGVEWVFDLSEQAWLWAMLFFLFTLGCGLIAWRSARHREPTLDQDRPADASTLDDNVWDVANAGPARMCGWLLLAFTSSVMFLATTNQLAQEVAAIPFLWVLPLAIYLLTFIIAFDRPQWYSRRWIPMGAAATTIFILPAAIGAFRIPTQVFSYGAFLFCICMLCHGELVRLRPGARQLTLFYLLIASGGALGGTFVSVAAPALFPDVWEFHAAILCGWIVIAFAWQSDRTSPFHRGDRAIFGFFVTIAAWLALRYLIERTPFGRVAWVSAYDWPITFAAGAALASVFCATLWKSRITQSDIWPRALVLLVVLLSVTSLRERIQFSRDGTLYAARNFYGVIRVMSMTAPGGEALQLIHGTTVHGAQITTPIHLNRTPTAYYSRSTGIALASTRLIRMRRNGHSGVNGGAHFGIVGIGVGTMSAFAELGDRVRYYEINPEVIDIVQGEEPYFKFMSSSAGELAVVSGDARSSLARELAEGGPQQFDLLVMDAFSSDAVPVHLVTLEAFRLYAAHLRDQESILAVNVTNRYLDLEAVVAANAEALGFHGVRVDSLGDHPVKMESSWILLARDPRVLDPKLIESVGGRPLGSRFVKFTDKYSNLFRVLK
jgi:hypothetical protein